MNATSRYLRSIGLAFAAALALGAPLRAQDAALVPASAPAAPSPRVDAAPAVEAGPTSAAASVAVRRAAADAPAPVMAAAGGHGRGTALMIVGGAAVLTGIVIGNDGGYAISVVGAVVGLYGLYLYLQ